MKRVYLDHAATTPVDPEVAEAMDRVLRDTHGNPSSIYAEGRAARELVDRAREEVAAALGAQPTEIVFTSGGTESVHLALRGAVTALYQARGRRPVHVISTAVEHSAVLKTLDGLQAEGLASATLLPVDRFGRLDWEGLKAACTRLAEGDST